MESDRSLREAGGSVRKKRREEESQSGIRGRFKEIVPVAWLPDSGSRMAAKFREKAQGPPIETPYGQVQNRKGTRRCMRDASKHGAPVVGVAGRRPDPWHRHWRRCPRAASRRRRAQTSRLPSGRSAHPVSAVAAAEGGAYENAGSHVEPMKRAGPNPEHVYDHSYI